MNLTNSFDYSYSGEIYIGSKGQALEVVYDTGSDWLCLESTDCTSCDSETYNYKDSSSFKKLQKKTSLREYGSASLEGIEVTDLACLVQHTEEEL